MNELDTQAAVRRLTAYAEKERERLKRDKSRE